MGWHVHYKDGKFNIWSTIVDEYILEDWTTEEVIIQAFQEKVAEDTKRRAEFAINMAKRDGCSALYPARHERDEI